MSPPQVLIRLFQKSFQLIVGTFRYLIKLINIVVALILKDRFDILITVKKDHALSHGLVKAYKHMLGITGEKMDPGGPCLWVVSLDNFKNLYR